MRLLFSLILLGSIKEEEEATGAEGFLLSISTMLTRENLAGEVRPEAEGDTGSAISPFVLLPGSTAAEAAGGGPPVKELCLAVLSTSTTEPSASLRAQNLRKAMELSATSRE